MNRKHKSMDNNPMEIIRGMSVGLREIKILEQLTILRMSINMMITRKVKIDISFLMALVTLAFLWLVSKYELFFWLV